MRVNSTRWTRAPKSWSARWTRLCDTASVSGAGDECPPRLIHIGAFAPFGCGASEKVRESEVGATQPTIPVCSDSHTMSMLAPLPGYALNHNTSFGVSGGFEPRVAADKVDKMLVARKFNIKGKEVMRRVEVAPARRRMCCRC